MDITTVTVVNDGVSLDYTNLTQEQKQKIVGEIVKGTAVPNIEIPAVGGGSVLKMRDIIDNTPSAGTPATPGSITFTFIRPSVL